MPRLLPFANIAKPRTTPVTGYQHFLTPLRKLIFDYDPLSPSQNGMRSFLRKPMLEMAKENPEIEVLVRKLRRGKAAVVRGHYINGRDKVICMNGLDVNEVTNKVKLLLSASGSKIKPLKNLTLEAGPGAESARGIWSSLHSASKDGGYRI